MEPSEVNAVEESARADASSDKPGPKAPVREPGPKGPEIREPGPPPPPAEPPGPEPDPIEPPGPEPEPIEPPEKPDPIRTPPQSAVETVEDTAVVASDAPMPVPEPVPEPPEPEPDPEPQPDPVVMEAGSPTPPPVPVPDPEPQPPPGPEPHPEPIHDPIPAPGEPVPMPDHPDPAPREPIPMPGEPVPKEPAVRMEAEAEPASVQESQTAPVPGEAGSPTPPPVPIPDPEPLPPPVPKPHPEPIHDPIPGPPEPHPGGPQVDSTEFEPGSGLPAGEAIPADQLIAAEPQPAPAGDDTSLKAVLEAVIYVTDEPLALNQIAAALEQPAERVRRVLDELIEEFNRPERGLTIREVAGGFKMATKPEHHEAVRTFVKNLKPPLKLSLAALETLAVIAYKQPITAPEIMEIRGVQGAGVLKTLVDRKLITPAGRKNVIGKPILYKTTKDFLLQFGLKDLSELPTLKEFEELRRLALTDADEEPAGEGLAVVAQSDPHADSTEFTGPRAPATGVTEPDHSLTVVAQPDPHASSEQDSGDSQPDSESTQTA